MLISWWRRALGLSWHGWRSFFAAQLEPEPPPAERPSFSSISLIQAATTASGEGQRLTNSDSDAAIIPIDAQSLGKNGFGRADGRYDREDFRPSSIGRTRSGLREPPRPSSSLRRCRGRFKSIEESSPLSLNWSQSSRNLLCEVTSKRQLIHEGSGLGQPALNCVLLTSGSHGACDTRRPLPEQAWRHA